MIIKEWVALFGIHTPTPTTPFRCVATAYQQLPQMIEFDFSSQRLGSGRWLTAVWMLRSNNQPSIHPLRCRAFRAGLFDLDISDTCYGRFSIVGHSNTATHFVRWSVNDVSLYAWLVFVVQQSSRVTSSFSINRLQSVFTASHSKFQTPIVSTSCLQHHHMRPCPMQWPSTPGNCEFILVSLQVIF